MRVVNLGQCDALSPSRNWLDGAASNSEGYLVILPSDGGAALVRVPLAQDDRDGTRRVVLLAPLQTEGEGAPLKTVGEGATFDHGAVCPNGGKVALAYTCSSLHIYNILSSREDYDLKRVRLQAMKSRAIRSKRLRHLAWQAFPYSYTVGAADPDELTLYDGWQSTTCGSFYLCVIKSSEPIDAWTWLDNPDVMGGGQRRDRIAVLAGNKVNIHDDVLSGKYERASGVAGGSSLLGAAAEKWKQIVPLPGGDDAVAFVAVLTEPCLQAQIRSRTEEGRGLNETLETLRSVQGQRKEKRKLKDKEGEGGDIAMDEGGESAAEHAGSSSSSSSSDAVVDLRGRIGGGGSGANAASSSLFDTLMGGITCTPASTLLLPTPPTTQSDDDDEGPTLLFLKVPVIPSTGPESQQEVLRSIPLDKKVVAMPTLLASSQTHVAIGDPWSSTLIVFRLSDDFPAVTTTEERQFQLPAGMVPRGLRVFGDHTLVCLAVEAAVAKGGGRGGEGGGAGGGATTQGGTTASFIELSLKEEEVRDELEVVGSGGGVSADSGQEQREQQQQQQQQGPADTMAFLRSFRDEMRERFDKLEGRMETLERRLSEL